LRSSPDGRRIRFTLQDAEKNISALWEVQADGKSLALMPPECLPPSSIHKQIARAYIDAGCIRVQDGQFRTPFL
jgi:hypothetical protein